MTDQPNPFDELGDLDFTAEPDVHEVLIEAYGLILQADCDKERKRHVLGRMRTVMENL